MPQAHTTVSLLPDREFPIRTSKPQFVTYVVTVSAGALASCLWAEQVYHKSRNGAIGSRKHNGYQSRADAVHAAVPPFLRTAEAGGFLEVSL